MRHGWGFAGLALALCLGIGQSQAQGDALEHLAAVVLKGRGVRIDARIFALVFDRRAQLRSAPCEAAATRWRMKSTMA